MDLHPVPFPTTNQQEDSSLIDARPTAPYRLHPAHSLPNLIVPHHYTFFPTQGPARHRPHLRPLDLASSYPSSVQKRDAISGNYSRRPSTLLTPPLTPSSSLRSTLHSDTPSTPPEPRSPPVRWISLTDRDRTLVSAHSTYTTHLKSLMGASTLPVHNGYLTPASARSQSLSSDDGSGVASGSVVPSRSEISTLASGLSCADSTLADGDGGTGEPEDFDLEETSVDSPTRLLLVRNVPATASSTLLRDAFCLGDVKGILARYQSTHGFVILAFYDARDAARALKCIAGKVFPTLGEVPLTAVFLCPSQVENMRVKFDFLSDLDGSFFVSVEGQTVQPNDIQNMLSAFGEIASFSRPGTDDHDQTFHVEFHDSRAAMSAHQALNGRTMFCGRISIFSNKDMLNHLIRLMQSDAREQGSAIGESASRRYHVQPRSVSTSGGVGTLDVARRVEDSKEEVSQGHGRRSSNDSLFDAVGKVFHPSPALAIRPRSVSVTASVENPVGMAGVVPYPYHEAYGYPYPAPIPMYPPYPIFDAGLYGSAEGDVLRKRYHWPYAGTLAPPQPHYPPSVPRAMYPFPMVPTGGSTSKPPDLPVTLTNAYGNLDLGDTRVEVPQSGQRGPGYKNLLDIAAIENGTDTRTTVMIKNIPNKMNDQNLKAFIDRVCPRRIDFMYLRMDFKNGCNVGYAFVNFISVQDLLLFASTQIGVKWNMYSSEKTLQMCYATYQGKESLVEKFKNSCIMDEKEAWRPKIYYSDGPMAGLPEPFPAPTHLRRKERSQHNRGALFVPGTHHQTSGGGASYHQRPQPPRRR